MKRQFKKLKYDAIPRLFGIPKKFFIRGDIVINIEDI